MSRLDDVAAAKAALEMMTLENQNLLEHFQGLLARLTAIEALPPDARRASLKEIEGQGAFQFNGIDIRRFQISTTRALPPKEFVARTRRRLDNTLVLLRDLLQRKAFPEGPELVTELSKAVKQEPDNDKAVVAFRDSVEALRNSPPFLAYMDVRKGFLKSDPEFRAQAEFVQTKESVAEGEEAVRARGEELEQLKTDMAKGKITPAQVQDALTDLPELK